MAKSKKWIQRANTVMKAKGTIGSFKEYCGGTVTAECIKRGLKSPNPAIRKKANFARNMRRLASKRKKK